jgi:hypothetical protein
MVIIPTLEAIKANTIRVTWTGVAGGDTCLPVALSNFPDKTVTIEGTVTTFALQGSNLQDFSNPRTLNDVNLSPSAITAAGVYTIKENPLLIAPLLTTGAGVTVSMVCKR